MDELVLYDYFNRNIIVVEENQHKRYLNFRIDEYNTEQVIEVKLGIKDVNDLMDYLEAWKKNRGY